MELLELDVSGCWQLTDKLLYALQENLLHMRPHTDLNFHLAIGGKRITIPSPSSILVRQGHQSVESQPCNLLELQAPQ